MPRARRNLPGAWVSTVARRGDALGKGVGSGVGLSHHVPAGRVAHWRLVGIDKAQISAIIITQRHHRFRIQHPYLRRRLAARAQALRQPTPILAGVALRAEYLRGCQQTNSS